MSKKYVALDSESVLSYAAQISELSEKLGSRPYRAREVGDGNLNLVFIVEGSKGGIVIKQALPYVRLVGESWPLPLSRAHYEHLALVAQGQCVPDLVPAVFYHDADMSLTAMQWLSPHIILRKALIQGKIYPKVGRDLGRFLAHTLLKNSCFWLSSEEKKAKTEQFLKNTAMCQITEDLVFDEPFFDAPLNKHNPHLADTVLALRADNKLILKVQELKAKFVNQADALLHGDLHTGSVMVTASDTKVIDPEFAFFGPMGFDVGCILANFMMAFFAQQNYPQDRKAYREWLASQPEAIWLSFVENFALLWPQRPDAAIYRHRVVRDEKQALDLILKHLWTESLGFAGCEIIRRILGLAHVEDFESIENLEKRALSEREALLFARKLITQTERFDGIDSLNNHLKISL